MVANEMNMVYPNRRNTGSYVSSRLMIACWIVGIRLRDGCVGMARSRLS